jgi:hypothetical protein
MGIGRSDMVGCLGEWVVSKVLRLPWDGMFLPSAAWQKWRRDGHDVGPLEVKATDRASGHLLIPEFNSERSPYVFVVVTDRPTEQACVVAGWCWGQDAKKVEYWKKGDYEHPYFEVPNRCLRPIEELGMELRQNGVEMAEAYCPECEIGYFGPGCPRCKLAALLRAGRPSGSAVMVRSSHE